MKKCRRYATFKDPSNPDKLLKRVVWQGSLGVDEYGHAIFYNEGKNHSLYDDGTWYIGYGAPEEAYVTYAKGNEESKKHSITWKLDRAFIGDYYIDIENKIYYKKGNYNNEIKWIKQDITTLDTSINCAIQNEKFKFSYDDPNPSEYIIDDFVVFCKENIIYECDGNNSLKVWNCLLADRTKYLSVKQVNDKLKKINRTDDYSENQEAVANSLNERLSVLQGELWYSVNYGWPLLSKPSKLICDTYIIERISNHSCVVSINEFKSSISNHIYSASVKVLTIFGVIDLDISK